MAAAAGLGASVFDLPAIGRVGAVGRELSACGGCTADGEAGDGQVAELPVREASEARGRVDAERTRLREGAQSKMMWEPADAEGSKPMTHWEEHAPHEAGHLLAIVHICSCEDMQ